MNIWSLLYFTSFLFYVFSGIFVLSLSNKSIINRLFFAITITLSAWSLGYCFSLGAQNPEIAMQWRGISTFGWTFFYSTMLVFNIFITHNQKLTKKTKYFFLLYIPSLIFFLRFLNHDTGNYVRTKFGWIYILYAKSVWSLAFDFYYLACVVASLILLLTWWAKSNSLRERKQVQIIVTTMMGAFFCGGLTDTILPLFGFEILPMGVVFSSIAIAGMWRAITKYKMMNLTQEIAAEHVLVTMMDPVIIMNSSFIIGRVNQAAVDLTGFSLNELKGEDVRCIVPDFVGDHMAFVEINSQGFTNGREIDLVSQDGTQRPCLCSGVHVMSDFGEKIGYILVLHDITSRKANEMLVQQVNAQLNLKIAKINNVFDNVREGILTFHADLQVQSEYSLECSRIFGHDIGNMIFPNLIFPNDPEMQKFTKDLLNRIFEMDGKKRELYFPLLPDEIKVADKNVAIHYKLTTDASQEPMMMAILTDTTEKIQLENQMDKERQILKMVIKSILNRDDFMELVDDYLNFTLSFFPLCGHDKEQLMRKIHTLKGNFSQFDVVGLVNHLDNLEDVLHKYLGCDFDEQIVGIQLAKAGISAQTLRAWVFDELEIIEGFVGKGFFIAGSHLAIEERQLKQLETQISNVMAEDSPERLKQVLDLLSSLRHKCLHDLLGGYPDFTVKLAQRWGKLIEPFEITGDRVYVDQSAYQELIKAMVHLFRNCIAHGIESEDDRIENGKEPQGHIRCRIQASPTQIQIIVEDDGRGIDLEAVEQKALSAGILSKQALSRLTDEEKMQLVFRQSLSTATSCDTLAGRGVGLCAVKAAVKQCGGMIQVNSIWKKGTSITITLPFSREVR